MIARFMELRFRLGGAEYDRRAESEMISVGYHQQMNVCKYFNSG